MRNQTKIKELLLKDFQEYERFSAVDEHYAAQVRLAEIFACLPYLQLADRAHWTGVLQNELMSDESLTAVEQRITEGVERLTRILSIGDQWNEDEFLLIILARSEFDLLTNYIDEKISKTLAVPTNLDSLIKNSLGSRPNQQAYRAAVNQIKRNRPMPFENKWLKLLD